MSECALSESDAHRSLAHTDEPEISVQSMAHSASGMAVTRASERCFFLINAKKPAFRGGGRPSVSSDRVLDAGEASNDAVEEPVLVAVATRIEETEAAFISELGDERRAGDGDEVVAVECCCAEAAEKSAEDDSDERSNERMPDDEKELVIRETGVLLLLLLLVLVLVPLVEVLAGSMERFFSRRIAQTLEAALPNWPRLPLRTSPSSTTVASNSASSPGSVLSGVTFSERPVVM